MAVGATKPRRMMRFLIFLLCCVPVMAAAPTLAQVQKLGPLRLKLPITAAEKALGKPSTVSKPHVEEATGRTVQTRTYKKHGLEVTYARDSEYQPWQIERFQAKAPCAWRNPHGVGIGTAMDVVRQKYAPLLEKETSIGNQLVVGSVYFGVIYAFEEGKVDSIFIGAAAE